MSEAGIYLIARLGPYINAETSAGGILGWVLLQMDIIRSSSRDYLYATEEYMAAMGKIIAKAQITNGGPVILVQPENEHTSWPGVSSPDFPTQMNREVMEVAKKQLRDVGVLAPLAVNDNLIIGYFAPGTGLVGGIVSIGGLALLQGCPRGNPEAPVTAKIYLYMGNVSTTNATNTHQP